MTRRFFAFLALISGLVALSGAATASYAHSTSECSASVSATAQSGSANQSVAARLEPGKRATREEDRQSEALSQPPRALRMPVLMGIERAYE